MAEVRERTMDCTVNEAMTYCKDDNRHLSREVGKVNETQVNHSGSGDHSLSLHSIRPSSVKGNELSGKDQKCKFMRIKDFVVLHRGVCFVMLSALCYGSLGIFVQLTPSTHAFYLGSIRGLFLIIFSTVGILFNKV